MKVSYVKSAKKSIYRNGKEVHYVSQKGKRKGLTLSRIDRTIPRDENDDIIVHKGESYYHWRFKNMERSISKTHPTSEQLSKYPKSEYQERFEDFSSRKEYLEDESERDELVSEIEEYRDELQSRLDSMPQQLQESSILNERIEELDSMISELDDWDNE